MNDRPRDCADSTRRRLLMLGLAACPGTGLLAATGASDALPTISAQRRLSFPRDHGSHPAARTEWWYATGWLDADGAPSAAAPQPRYGFQVTFFRSRSGVADDHPSRFAANQLVFAHAAVTDLEGRRLRHDQRLARSGFGIAGADEHDTKLVLRGWTFERDGPPERSRYRVHIDASAAGFELALQLDTTQPLLLQGSAGFSRKGPQPEQASHYYSQPQLATTGTLGLDGRTQAVRGRAWLDHEWSDALLDPQAVGWDWIGMNLFDGRALTAFRLRRADGSALYAGGSLRAAGESAPHGFSAADVSFAPGRRWTSPGSRAVYPVEWEIITPAGRHRVRALLDAQELDSRASTGAIYWEGLSELLDAGGARIGLGYLEMTGYAGRLALS